MVGNGVHSNQVIEEVQFLGYFPFDCYLDLSPRIYTRGDSCELNSFQVALESPIEAGRRCFITRYYSWRSWTTSTRPIGLQSDNLLVSGLRSQETHLLPTPAFNYKQPVLIRFHAEGLKSFLEPLTIDGPGEATVARWSHQSPRTDLGLSKRHESIDNEKGEGGCLHACCGTTTNSLVYIS